MLGGLEVFHLKMFGKVDVLFDALVLVSSVSCVCASVRVSVSFRVFRFCLGPKTFVKTCFWLD